MKFFILLVLLCLHHLTLVGGAKCRYSRMKKKGNCMNEGDGCKKLVDAVKAGEKEHIAHPDDFKNIKGCAKTHGDDTYFDIDNFRACIGSD